MPCDGSTTSPVGKAIDNRLPPPAARARLVAFVRILPLYPVNSRPRMSFLLRTPVGVSVGLAALTAGAIALYVGQFSDTNAYIGIGDLPLRSVSYWWLMGAWVVIVGLLLPARPQRPSDVFLVLYLLGCGLWSASYWPATGHLDVAQAAVLGLLLLLPAAAVHATAALTAWRGARPSHLIAMFRRRALLPALLGLLVLAALLSYRVAGGEAGFSFDEATTRRLAGRESFSGNALAAYLLQMSANGLAPFAAFLGMLRRSRTAVAGALAFGVLCFWLLGLKSPVLNVLVLAALGWLVRSGRVGSLAAVLMGGLAALMAAALLELYLLDLSLIAEFGIRRVILVNATVQAYFFDALARTDWPSLITSGIDLVGHTSPEYYVGAVYLGSELTNANTNAFLHELASHGLPGYAVVLGGTCVVLAWCDHLWHSDRRPDGFAFAAILGMLMVEQAFGTALVSSGLLVCMLLSAFFARRSRPAPALKPSGAAA